MNLIFFQHCFEVGYTGDPFVGCVDIDECAHEDLNTCSGGMYANGFDGDMQHGTYGPWYLGENGFFGSNSMVG